MKTPFFRALRTSTAVVCGAVLAPLFLGLFSDTAHAVAPPTKVAPTTWNNVEIWGGGYCTGIVIHPNDGNLMYARSDVGGAFRWDSTNSKWIPISDTIVPARDGNWATESIAIDTSSTTAAMNTVYLASNGYIHKSTDRGANWKSYPILLPGSTSRVFMDGNMDGRWQGERLLVDPNNSNVLFFGSRRDGLFKSTDGGVSWNAVSTFTARGGGSEQYKPFGITFIAFDKGAGLTSGASSTLYVGVYGGTTTSNVTVTDMGVYRSIDGGSGWSKLGGFSVQKPQRGTVAPNGTLWVTHTSGVTNMARGSSGGLVKKDPSQAQGWSYCALAVDPQNSNHIVVAENYNKMDCKVFRTTDGGSNWITISKDSTTTSNSKPATYVQSAGWRAPNNVAGATTSLAINPSNSNQVWMGDYYNLFRTDDISASTVTWTAYSKGYEMMVVHDLTAPKSGTALLFSSHADNDILRHTSLSTAPATRSTQLSDGTSTDYCEADPNFVVHVGSTNWDKGPGGGGTSIDNGVTYTPFGTISGTTIGYNSATYMGGKVAVGSTKQGNGKPVIVWAPKGTVPLYSKDFGATWATGSGAPSGAAGGYNDDSRVVAADKVDGNTFYLWRGYSGYGELWYSTDGGVNWARSARIDFHWNHSQEIRVLRAMPGKQGEVWLSLKDFDNDDDVYATSTQGLWRITGANTPTAVKTKIARVDAFAKNPGTMYFGFGKSAAGRTNPTLYVYGKIDGVTVTNNGREGIWRSDDATSFTDDATDANWTRLYTPGVDAVGFNKSVNQIEGDMRTYGRLYVGSGGRGVWYGDSGAATGPSPLKYEAEDATVAAISTGDTERDYADSMLSNGEANVLEANATDDFITYTVKVPEARTYGLKVRVKKGTNRGKFRLSTANSTTSTYTDHPSGEQDLYNTAFSYNELDLGTITFTTSGDKAFRFKCTGKNGSSSGFTLHFDYFQLTPQ